MSCSEKKAWSCNGSLKEASRFGGDSKKLFKHWPSPFHGGLSGVLNAHGGKKLMKTAQDSFDYVLGPKRVHNGYSLNNSFGSRNGWKNEGLFSTNPRETMTVLNDRLANYLGQVAKLEEENIQLERKIQAWHVNNAPKELPNYSNYFTTIKELQKEVFNANSRNAQTILQIDNARIAGDDLLNKYNMERGIYNILEADIQALRKGLDGLNLEKGDFELRIKTLGEEMESLKKTQQEEVNRLKTQLGARVDVRLDAAPSVDLNVILLDIRNEYESLMKQNMKDVENWFVTQSEMLNEQIISRTQQLQMEKTESIELRHVIHTLEIDLQAELNKKLALEGTLADTKDDYMTQLASIQDLVHNVETELARLRCDQERQNHEYNILMDLRSRLEMEIATYQRLLQEEDMYVRRSVYYICSRKRVKIVSITEDYEDGKFVAKQEQVHHI
ncbi:keratin, type I cuticular Ha4-like [Eleutherodactylus coqui]|uniref:keratin, type I cuticular Ha4-like n=1 Tax=Eleutherodactylus coqui TaxID=57060 RepID=UPI0034631B0E